MGFLLNMLRFAQKYPFKCPECADTAGEFYERDGQMMIRCRGCGKAEAFDPSILKDAEAPRLTDGPPKLTNGDQ